MFIMCGKFNSFLSRTKSLSHILGGRFLTHDQNHFAVAFITSAVMRSFLFASKVIETIFCLQFEVLTKVLNSESKKYRSFQALQ